VAGGYGGALTSYERAAALATGDAADAPPPAPLARIEGKLGNLHGRRGHWELAESHYAAARAALGEEGSAGQRARLYADWSLTTHQRGDLGAAIDLARRALALAEGSGDHQALAQAHNLLGILAGRRGDRSDARKHLEQSAALAERLGHPGVRAAALNNLALACGGDGETERAIHLAESALALCVAQGDRHREAALHSNLADLLHRGGRSEAAMAHLKRAVAIYAEIGVEAGAVQPHIWRLTEW